MKPFMGLLGLSGSFTFFLAGDMGGDIMEPDTDTEDTDDLTAEGSKFAIPCRSVSPPVSLRPPGENWSDNSWLQQKQ